MVNHVGEVLPAADASLDFAKDDVWKMLGVT